MSLGRQYVGRPGATSLSFVHSWSQFAKLGACLNCLPVAGCSMCRSAKTQEHDRHYRNCESLERRQMVMLADGRTSHLNNRHNLGRDTRLVPCRLRRRFFSGWSCGRTNCGRRRPGGFAHLGVQHLQDALQLGPGQPRRRPAAGDAVKLYPHALALLGEGDLMDKLRRGRSHLEDFGRRDRHRRRSVGNRRFALEGCNLAARFRRRALDQRRRSGQKFFAVVEQRQCQPPRQPARPGRRVARVDDGQDPVFPRVVGKSNGLENEQWYTVSIGVKPRSIGEVRLQILRTLAAILFCKDFWPGCLDFCVIRLAMRNLFAIGHFCVNP